MITPAQAQKNIQESLDGFPQRITAAYLVFAESGDLASLDLVAMGVLEFYLARKPENPLDELPGSTRLVDELGCDSLTMMDTVFMMETLFNIKLEDSELPKIITLDDLRAHLTRSLAGGAAAAL
jgi:acyl carrier protein